MCASTRAREILTAPKRHALCVVRRPRRHMPAPETNAALPSAETLARAARQVGDAYPGLYAHHANLQVERE
jgi:hypothetical protein